MALNYQYLDDLGLLSIHWQGRLTLGDLARAFETLSADPAVRSAQISLSDFSEVESMSIFHFGLDMLRQVIGDQAGVPLEERPHHSAIFIDDRRVLSELVNFATMLNRIPHLHVKVFEDKAEAIAWLGLPAEAIGRVDPA